MQVKYLTHTEHDDTSVITITIITHPWSPRRIEENVMQIEGMLLMHIFLVPTSGLVAFGNHISPDYDCPALGSNSLSYPKHGRPPPLSQHTLGGAPCHACFGSVLAMSVKYAP